MSPTLKEGFMLNILKKKKRILRRIIGPKWDENREQRKLHSGELHCLYRLPNVVRVIKSRRSHKQNLFFINVTKKIINVTKFKGGIQLKVFKNKIMRHIFGPKWNEKGEWTSLHREELHCLYRLSNVVRMIKSRR